MSHLVILHAPLTHAAANAFVGKFRVQSLHAPPAVPHVVSEFATQGPVLVAQQPVAHDCAVHWHEPLTQVVPLPHALPHVPQLALSSSVPLAHAHVPPAQCSPCVHTLPQVPQLLSSPKVPPWHAHAPLVHCSPWLHTLPQVPQLPLSPRLPLLHLQTEPLHFSPSMHAAKHEPQFWESLVVSTHPPPHCEPVGAEQLSEHEVPLHVA